MSKYKKIGSAFITKQDKRSLESLVLRYLEKSDELEDKESRVLRQMELMQSAVASLQGLNHKRTADSISGPVIVNVAEVEEETRKIRDETLRIQKEIQQKITDNQKLQLEVNKQRLLRNLQQRSMEQEVSSGERTPEDYAEVVDREKERKKLIEEVQNSQMQSSPVIDVVSSGYEDDDDDSLLDDDPNPQKDRRIKFFQDKIRKLKELERKLKKESEEDARLSKVQRQKLVEKIEMLEWEAEIDRQLIKSLKRKYHD